MRYSSFYSRSGYKLGCLFLISALAVYSKHLFAVDITADGKALEINGDAALSGVNRLRAKNGGVLTVKNIKNNIPSRIEAGRGGSVLLEGGDFSGDIKKTDGRDYYPFIQALSGGRMSIKNSSILIKNDKTVLLKSDTPQFNVVESSVTAEGEDSIAISVVNNVTLSESQVTARKKNSAAIGFRANGAMLEADNSTIAGNVIARTLRCLKNCGELKLKNHSSLTGRVINIYRLSLDDSRWELTKNSDFNYLDLKGGRVIFTPDGSFKTLSVDSLSGEGIFQMNTNLSAGQSDQLIVRGENAASGRHQLAISDSGNEPERATEFQRLVLTHGGDAEFTLAGGHVDLGAYRYTLQKQGNDWQLTRGGKDAVVSADAGAKKPLPVDAQIVPALGSSNLLDMGSEMPAASSGSSVAEAPASATAMVAESAATAAATETITPEKPAMAEVNAAPELSSGANAALASQTALSGVVQSAAALPDQRDDAGRGGVWVKSSASRVSHAAGQARAFSQQRNATLLGVGGSAAAGSGELEYGVTFGSGDARQNFGEGSRGHISHRSEGVYGRWQSADGLYLSGSVSLYQLKNQLDVSGNLGQVSKGRQRVSAWGGTLRAGQTFSLNDGWFIEPHAGVTAVRLGSSHYRLDNGLEVETQRSSPVQGRVGVSAGRQVAIKRGLTVEPWVSVAWVGALGKGADVKV
ncbi:autotransporter outer membrane beta-barrel domain-containing protein, partial [Erwinia sp. Eh17-17]|uniref:autotransporter outer membrane beta-barrel domain-containing protein n=1 Tax=Erwinia sp. Eh17-17 TaxID=3080330 RepID=UPI00320916BF